MTESKTATAARMRRQRKLMRIVNVPMRRVLALPFPTPLASRLMLLRITGRKSGRIYRQPVSYVRDGETLLSPGGGRWTLNLTGADPVPARLGGRDRTLVPDLVTDPAEVRPLLARLQAGNPRASSFMPFLDARGEIDEAALDTALNHGFCIVRWHLNPPEPGTGSRRRTNRSATSRPNEGNR